MKEILLVSLLLITCCTSPEPTAVPSGIVGGVVGGVGKVVEVDFSQVKHPQTPTGPTRLPTSPINGPLKLPSGAEIELIDQNIKFYIAGPHLNVKYKSLYSNVTSIDFLTELNSVQSYWASQVDSDKKHPHGKINTIEIEVLLNQEIYHSQPFLDHIYFFQRSKTTDKWQMR